MSTAAGKGASTPSPMTFASLPTEIRLQIWGYASLQTRVIEFSIKVPINDILGQQQYLKLLERKTAQNQALGTGFRSDVTWKTRTRAPSLLSVNREARCVALEVYTLPFDLEGVGAGRGGSAGWGRVAYINPALDTIYCNVYASLQVHYLLSDLESCDNVGNGALSLALTDQLFAECLVCTTPDGLRGSRYMSTLSRLILVAPSYALAVRARALGLVVGRGADMEEGRGGEGWKMIEMEMPREEHISFQYKIGKAPFELFNNATRNIDEAKRPKFKYCVLQRMGK